MSSLRFAFGPSGDAEKQIDVGVWRSASAANERSLEAARVLLRDARSRVAQAIPGTRFEDVDYMLQVERYPDAVRCMVSRSDDVLLTTLTIAPVDSTLTREELPFDPPCCVVMRAPGALFSRDADEWLPRFEEALAIAVLEASP